MSKVDAYPMLKTVVFTLQNGKNLTAAMALLIENAKSKRQRKAYENILKYLQEGQSFSEALEKYCICSSEVVYFVAMAEKGAHFHNSLAKVVEYIQTKENFKQESSDKLTMPLIYFFLAVIVVAAVYFIALPMQFQRAQEYSPEVLALIENHLAFAKILSNLLIFFLIVVAFYFFITTLSMFSRDRLSHTISSKVVHYLPFAKKIVLQFEKFVVFMMLGQMLHSGIGLKKALQATLQGGGSKTFQKGFQTMLCGISKQGVLQLPKEVFDSTEQSLLQGVGSNAQMGESFTQIATRAKYEAMNLSKKFFRYITLSAVLLMALAVFIEFYVVVLTQVLLQKGLIDMGNSGVLF